VSVRALFAVDLSPILAGRDAAPFPIPPFEVLDTVEGEPLTATVTVHADRTNRGVRFRGTVRGTQESACARCLKAVRVPLAAEIDEEAVEARHQTGEELAIGKGNTVDLGRLAIEALDLVRELAPICSPPCPERCGLCGGEHTAASCPTREVDPRLASLAALLTEDRDDEPQIG